MNQLTIEQLFQRYIVAFQQQDLGGTRACYQLPCTLYTPDKAVLIASEQVFTEEFSQIFTVLAHANITDFKALNSSYSVITEQLVLACVTWQFIDHNNDIFTDFSAFYHLALIEQQWKIVSVVSQELDQSINLATPFNIQS